jgi:hypothetical protein
MTVPTFVTATPGSMIGYSVFTRDLAVNGASTISVASTLNNYNFSPARTAPMCSSTFLLTVINPCDSTVISTVPVVIEDVVAFSGYSVQSLKKYTFNDTNSASRTLSTDSSDYCGEKLLTF